ncbi:E3 ubiquitin-protein ligase sina-like [Neocloeon triangulifer]|uniref:E3 ubiquitin-protein ligase sina-like n=1 Tax=Neocloeon triangulifer TaxID=2078957 RepID=UPI00286F1776|nr:E3 ubiquitin-protein ligase sina-like [Neocloeon triangulifer]
MESGRKGGAGPSGSYRRIIPPLNDTDSDSSLEYWEEKGLNESSFSPRMKQPYVKKERIDPEEELVSAACMQRIVYKVKNNPEPERPPRNEASTGTNGGPASGTLAPISTTSSVASVSSESSGSSATTKYTAPTFRNRMFVNLGKLTLTPAELVQRDILRSRAEARYVKRSADISSEPAILPPMTDAENSTCDHSYATNQRDGSPPVVINANNHSTPILSLTRPTTIPSSTDTPVLDTTASPPPAKRLRMSDEGSGLNSNILSMIECPVCLEYMGPPIHQCRRGHLVCSSCRAQLVNCPTCRSRFTDLRNLVLERIVEMIRYPCKHDNCCEMYLLKNKGHHELNCQHRRYTCMAQGCDWRGVHSELVPHVRSVHSGLIHDGNHIVISFPIQMLANSSRNYVLHAFNEMFRVNFQRGPGNTLVHGAVIYLGPIDNAKNFTFQFKMEKEKDGIERGITFKRTVLSDEQKPSNYYNKSEAFSATVDMLRLISTSKGKVHVTVLIERKISKKEDSCVPSIAGNESNDDPEETEDK